MSRRKRNRARKMARGIQGVTVEEIQRRRRERPEVRAANRDAALREVKERKKAGQPGARKRFQFSKR